METNFGRLLHEDDQRLLSDELDALRKLFHLREGIHSVIVAVLTDDEGTIQREYIYTTENIQVTQNFIIGLSDTIVRLAQNATDEDDYY